MGSHRARLGTLTIPNGDDQSNVLGSKQLSFSRAVAFFNAAAYTGTVAVLVGPDDDSAIGDMLPLEVDGNAVILEAGVMQEFNCSGFRSIALDSGSNEDAERAVEVFCILETT